MDDAHFTGEEARKIFAEAAERQRMALEERRKRLSLDEVIEAGEAAGIDPAYLRQAAANVLRPEPTVAERTFLGVPVEFKRTVLLDHVPDDDEWGQIVHQLRTIFKTQGVVSEVGRVREWASAVKESEMPVRVLLRPASITLFPAVRAQMSSASRMGTPLESIVPKVRENRATATFFSSEPKIGSLRKIASVR